VLTREAGAAERRLRFNRGAQFFAKAWLVAAALAGIAIALRKTGHLAEGRARIALFAFALSVIVAFAIGFLRRLPRSAGARALDRAFQLSDRVTTALTFARLPEAERTGFTEAAVDDACRKAENVRAKVAVPLTRPREAGVGILLAALVVAMSLFEVRTREIIAQAKTIDAVEVTADDLDAMREFLRELEQKEQTDESKENIREFNQLIEDLSNKRLDRTDAFKKMQQLEEKLLKGREADAKALEEAMKKIGEELSKAELTKPAGEALENKKLAEADKRLKELAKKLREQGKNIDKQQLEKMREALKKASESQKNREEALAKKREELEKQLLKEKQKQQDGGAPNEQEKSLLEKKQRELERLDREQKEAAAAGRQLERLDRELAQAAEDLMKDLGLSASDLDKSAEDINRMAKEQMSDEEKEQLRQRLEELRQMLRQQGQGGQAQMKRLKMFQKKARGGKGGQPGQGGQKQPGQGQEGEGQEGEDGEGEGKEGQGQKPGGQGQGEGEGIVMGPGGQKMLVLSQGQGGQGQGGQGQGKGPGAGTGHDDNLKGAATNPKVGTQDTQIAGQDTGQGNQRSESIRAAAERGFVSRGYKKVYREYQPVAEEAIERDEIPGGYRGYVRRYFQLIRPRDE